MAFARPSLSDLVARVSADFVSRLSLTGALLRRSMLGVIARVIAGAAHMLHGHLEYLGRQIFPDQSDGEFLVRQAAVYGLTRNPPTFARSIVEFAGTNGITVPAGTVLTRSDGARYETLLPVTIAAGVGSTTAQALVAGSAGTLEVGVAVTLESPITGIASTATCDDHLLDGTDEESIDSLRARLLARISDPPQGGSVADYIAWTKGVAGVTRVWVTPWGLGPGTVLVRFARDNDALGPIPDSGEVAAVQAAIDLVRPATAQVTVAAPVAAPVNFTLEITPDNADTRAAVEAQLRDVLTRRGEPGGTLLLSELRTAVGTASGLTDYSMTAPVADTVFSAGQLPTFGVITWI